MSSESPPRALVIGRNLPPLTGGMERLNFHSYLALRKQFKVAVCGPAGVRSFLSPDDICTEIPTFPISRFLVACQWRAWWLALRLRPNLVYSGSGLTAPAALVAARTIGARTVCFLHGLDIVTQHPVYRRLFLPAIRAHDRVLVNSQHTAGLAKAVGVKPDRIRVVHPGVELPELSDRTSARDAFRRRFELGDRPVILAAGRLTERKGLAPFIRYSLPEIVRRQPETLFLVVGDEASDALQHRQGVTAEIRKATTEAGLESRVRLLGRVTDHELSQAYFAADLLVFPVIELPGDIEGFGMVAIEAAAHGLQTVAFRVGGVGDAVVDGVSGWLIGSGDYAEMSNAIIDALGSSGARKSDNLLLQARRHAERFRWDNFETTLLESLPMKQSQRL